MRGRELAMVFQDPMIGAEPGAAGRRPDRRSDRGCTTARRRVAPRARRSIELLERVGLTPAAVRARAYPHELSGGMRQRVMLAMALVNRPQVLIADEPTTALDVTTQAQILDLILELQSPTWGLALVIVSHDLGVVAGLADRVVVMYAGRVVEEAPADRLFANAGHPYTRGLLGAVPRQRDGRVPLLGDPREPARPHERAAGVRVPSPLLNRRGPLQSYRARAAVADGRTPRRVPVRRRGVGGERSVGEPSV